MDLKLQGKKALVMGSSTGIGRGIAEALKNEGAIVGLCARHEARLQSAVTDLKADWMMSCDLTQKGAAQHVVQQFIKKFGSIDIAVVNSGGPPKGGILEIKEEQWHTQFQNLWMSVVETLQAALPSMKQQKFGRVLCVTSSSAKEPIPGLMISSGLRAGLTTLLKAVANEVAVDGVTLNLILPGFIDTDRLRELNLTEETVKKMIPAQRLGTVREIGDLAAFLASPRASYITGQSLVVDGGYLKGT